MKNKNNKIVLVAIIIIIVLFTIFIIIKKIGKTMNHDEIKREIVFNNITKQTGTVIELENGENTIYVYLERGQLDIKLYSEKDIILNESFKTSKKIEIEASRKGGYVIKLTGKHATGKIKY